MFSIPFIILLTYCNSLTFFRNTFVNGFETSFVTRSDCVFEKCLNNNNYCNVPFYLHEFREKDHSFTCNINCQNITEFDNIRRSEKAFKVDSKINKFKSYFDLWKNYHLIFLPLENVGEKCMKDTASLMSSVENNELWALKSKLI